MRSAARGAQPSRTLLTIPPGHVSQFAEVKKPSDRSRSKVKDATAANEGAPTPRGASGRARGGDSIRGRGRGTDRGRGGFRGPRGGAANGTRTSAPSGPTSVPTTESSAWENPAATEAKEDVQPKAVEASPAKTEAPKHEAPKHAAAAPTPAAAAKTWASMFASVPKPAVPKPAAKPAPPQEEPAPVSAEAAEVAQEPAVEAAELPPPPIVDDVVDEPLITAEETSKLTPDKEESAGPELTLTPSKDELTKDNIEHLPDDSTGPPTETVASTVASSKDIGSLASVATPLSTGGQAPIGRPGIGGYQTTALKATSGAHRSTSFQRRLQEQHEAVVMPGNHAVNQAAVQFGSLGLNGDVDVDNLDVDEDREDAETRTQPPQHSPVAQPRAALPPAPRQASTTESQPQESIPTPKQAPGLPPVPQQPLSQQSPALPLASQAMQNQGSQSQQPYNQFGRYGQAETAAPPQKPYDPFGQQAPQSSQYDYPGQQQAQQQPSQTQIGGFSSAPEAFGSQYPTAEQQRSVAYQQYYGNYAQQGTPSQQEAGVAQQRSGSAFGAGPNDSAFSQSQSQQQSQSRYNEAQNSGHNTPNPALGGQHPSGPASQQQGQHMQQPHGQPGHAGNYPYTHPYYASNPYYANYASQYGGYGQQGGYQNFGKSMYGQSHHYGGMPPQGSFDQHSSSPANVGAFGGSSAHGRDSGLGGGLGEYGRSVSGAGQNQHNATAGSGAFGGIPDSYRQPQGGYGGQSSYGQQQIGQQGPSEDSLKPFGDSKSGGPSPSALGAQPGRPGSATNNPQSQGSQTGLPQQQGFGGYPSHLQGGQGNQYGGLGGLGHQGAGNHQNNFGQYGGFGGGYGSYSRGGWGTNYQQH
jgi:hypothetical protein